MAVAVVNVATDTDVYTNSPPSGSISINLDGATAVVVLLSAYTWEDTYIAAVLNWDDHATNNDFAPITFAPWATTDVQAEAWIMTSASGDWPGSGSQTLYWDAVTTLSQGVNVCVFTVSGSVTADPIIDTDSRGAGGDWTASLSGVSSGDLAVVVGVDAAGVAEPVPSGSGQTSICEMAL